MINATTDDYLKQLQNLLPPGAAWTREKDSTLTELLTALAEEFARLHNRGNDLVAEADPRTTYELLPDWEWVFGLPDQCAEVPETIAERRQALEAKITNLGGQSRRYFIDLAARFGITITISENPALFQWTVNASTLPTLYFRAGAGVAGEPLRVWGQEAFMECLFQLLKPAHTEVLFTYV